MPSTFNPARLASVLEDLAEQRKLRELARRLGEADASKFSQYKGRGSFPGPDLLARLCRELNISADWILGLSDRRELLQGSEIAEPEIRYTSVQLTEERLRAVVREEMERLLSRRR